MSPKTYTVSDTFELHAAIDSARGGDTIELKSGIYEGIDIRGASFSEAVTITSADPDNPAVFHDKTSITNSKNLIFDNLEMQHTDPQGSIPSSSWKALFYVANSSDITLSNSKIMGAEAQFTDESRNLYEGVPFGAGIRITGSQDVTITGNEITDLFKGIGLGDTENVVISNNHIHKIRVDGIGGTDHKNTLIEENLFENFTPHRVDPDNPNGATDDHSDMIQYWGTGAEFGVHDFTIRDNVFLQDKIGTQTIFGRLNLRSTDDADAISFTNFEISGNLIYNGHANGITLSDITGAKVFDNTVLANEMVLEDHRKVPTINVRYDGVRAADDGFDLTDENVQASRDIQVYNNVLTYAHEPEIVIRAYSKHVNERDDVKAALNISEHGNHWISSRLLSDDYYEYIFKMAYEVENGTSTLSLDGRSADIYGNAGSAYYKDVSALQAFFNKLNTSADLSVNTDLSDIEFADLPELLKNSIHLDVTAPAQEDDTAPVVSKPAAPKTPDVTVSEDPDVTVSEDKAQADTAAPNPTHEGDDNNNNKGQLRGSKRDDVIAGYDGNDFITASSGEDIAYGGAGDDRVHGKNGDDTLLGGSGHDYLMGGSGADILIGGSGDDTLMGGAQTDIMVNGAGNDLIHGGGGFDIIVLEDDPAKYDIYLTDRTLRIEHRSTGDVDVVKAVEALYFKDTDALYTVDRRSGDTTFMERSEHKETYATLNEMTAQDYNAEAMETQSGEAPATQGDAEPILHGTDAREVLWGNGSTEAIFGHGGNDSIFGLRQDDVLIGGEGKDRLRGDAGDDALVGGKGNDKLVGQVGEDLLLGGSGKDFISGGAQNDIVVGGLHNDRLIGGSGDDTAVLTGRYQDYDISTNTRTNITTVTHKDTGEVDLLSGIEQLYFEQQARLYALSDNGDTTYMRASQHVETYALLKDTPWDAYSDEMIY